MDPMIEARTFSECRAESSGKLVGYAVVYDRLSRKMPIGDGHGFYELFEQGAFARSISSGEDVRATREHDPIQLLGRTTNGTLKLADDRAGVLVEIDPPASQVGRETLELVRRGDLRHMSFQFRAFDGSDSTFDDWSEQDNGDIIRTVKTAQLIDVSIVADPAYLETSVAVRSFSVWRKRRLFAVGAARARELELIRARW